MAKKVFKKNKKARFFLISREFLAPQKKIFKYCLRYWKRRIKRKIKLIKLRFSKRSTALLAVLKDKIKKQAYILRGKNFYMSFRPFCVAQGIAVFVLTLCILFTAAWFVSPKPRISQSQIIKTALTKQTSPAVVGQTVKWSAVIKKSDITAGANLVQLPKNAQNIKVKSITKQEALAIANYSAETSQFQFAAEERKQLTKTEPKNFLSKVYRFFLADVHGAAENAVAQITESIAESQPEIIETNEAVFVDVSEALPAEEPEPEVQQPAESPADNQAGEEPEQPQEQIAEEEPAQSSEPARNDAAASGGDIELGEPAESPADNQAGEEPIEEEFVESESERQEEIDESEQEAISELPEIPVIEPVSLSNQEIIQLPGELLTETTTPTDQEVVEIEQSEETEEYVEVDYETPAPEITEQETDKGKLVTISAEEQPDQPPITNVLAYTTIPEIYKVGQESKIKIKWQNPDCEAVEDPRQAEACRDNGYAEMEFHAFDLNNNGKLDYVEWTVPHLSEQIFEIIFISKAFEMDENQQIVADIYDLTVAQDNQWATVPNGHYVRATFEQILDNTKDNTIYAKPTNPGQPATIEVYPIYEDQDGNQTQGGLVATFESIDHEGMYGILLTNLGTPTDIFDLKIISGDIDIDWIVDPSNIAYGAENAFASASTTYVSTAMLTSTSFVIAYRDSTGYGTAVVGSISGTTISYGTPVAFNSAATTYISVAALDSTHFVAAYSDVGNSDVGTAIVGEVSGTTISSYGAESVFNTVTNANSISISVAALDSTHFVVLCKSNVPPATNRGYAIVGVVSGTTITGYGTQSTFSTGVVTYVSVAALSSTSFVFGFFATYGRSRIGTVDGTTISYGTEKDMIALDVQAYISFTKLSATSFVVGYTDSNTYGTAAIGSVSGTTITYGAAYPFNSAATAYVSVSALDSTHFIAGYQDTGNSSYGTALAGTISGTDITYEDEAAFNSASTAYVSVAALDTTNFVAGYQDTGNSSYGTGIIGVYSGGAPANTAPNAPTLVSPANGSYTTDTTPTLSANYSDPDVGDVGTTNYRISSSSLADCVSNTNIVASGTSSETADENEDTTWTNGSSIGNDATYYWCAQNNDGVDTSSWTQMGNFILDTAVAVPTVTSVGGDTSAPYSISDTSPEILITLDEAGDCYASETDEAYDDMSGDTNCTGDTTTSITCQMGTLAESASKTIYVACQDTAGNKDTIATNEEITMEIDATPPVPSNFSPASASTITDATPTITFDTDETADCFASTDGDETYDQMSDDTDCTVGTSTSHSCALGDLGADGAKTVYVACQDDTSVSPNKDTADTNETLTYTLDTTVPILTVTSVGGDTSAPYSISDTSPEILITLDEAGDCYASETDEAYDDMSGDTNCTGDTTTSITCQMGTLAESASKTIYVACQDTAGNKDTIATNEEITMEIDATPPTISGFNPAAGGVSSLPSSVSFTLNEAGYCRSSASDLSYSAMASADDCSGGGTTSITCSISGSSALSLSVNISCQDILENENTADNNTNLSYTLSSGGGGGGTFSWNPFAGQEQGSEAENILDNLDEAVDQIAQQITNQINNATEQISNLAEKAADFYKNTIINNFQEPEQVSFPPIEETVTPETPAALQNQWNLIQQKRFNEISILPLPDEIKQLALDFPSFQETLEKVGFTKPEDVEKIRVAKLSFPGLAETLGRVSAGINPSNFSIKDKIKMPTNFIFARVTEDKIDFKTKVSLASDNDVTKSITTLQNKPLYLIVKPDKPAKKVTGYIVFKSVSSESALKEFAAGLSPALSASLIDAFTLPQQPGQEIKATKELVLNKFEYQDSDKDGIYTATITSPAVAGKYEIKTIIDYISQDYSSAELNMIMVVDPEGYVYRKISDNDEARIKGAEVTIYWLNPETKQFEIWPAKDFQQENPQTTDNTGKYSFLVPEGFYYIEVKAEGYIPYKGDIFEVQEGSGVHTNIELKIANWWQRTFTIERVLLGLITILLLALLIVLSVIILKRKTQII
ncbi:MAG: hypothetical protein A2601_00715 [Candidatus Staskawiczbacteria bacterium RIFOXYD1_FULL_37_73]|nr:MAG: hypothetical protein A2353_00930 [Candidatus Staskawiczbacteria bacterium RIFOXYB1_FULL_38_37]OGZ90483.1 MAG: hypothetical protein A2601_00715 [Candidatus Staskawiczbacteria bacterium RIFOXYD1_FULL_37_73]